MADCLALLLSMDVIGGMLCPFTNVIDAWVYVVGLLVLEIILYQQFDDTLIPAGAGMIVGVLMATLLPAGVISVALMVFIVNFGLMLYSMFTKP